MKKLVAAVLAIATLAACAPTQPRHLRDLPRTANPSAVLATEIAFARAAQERGQWTAFRQYATRDAVMFMPDVVNAQDWLRRQADPPQSVRWQPHAVWSSCDGSLAVTRGASQWPSGAEGYFATVWQRQRNGDYRWVMDYGDLLAAPLPAPEMLGATVADCSRPGAAPAPAGEAGNVREGASEDGTLRWRAVVRPDLSLSVAVQYWDGTAWREAFSDRVAGN